MTIYICSECGKEIPPDSDFCYHCGSLKSKAYTIEYKNDGSASEQFACPECGIIGDENTKFCRHCGVEIDRAVPKNVNRPRPAAGPSYGGGYGTMPMPVLQKNGGFAMFMSIIFGFVGIYGIGHLIMKKWSRGLMFLAMSAVNWYIYISVGTFPFFVMLISLMLFFKQSMEITNIAYGRS